AVARTTGTATVTPGTRAISFATSSGTSPPSPELTSSAVRPAIVSMISSNASCIDRVTRSSAHTSATPSAMATIVSIVLESYARRKRSGMRKLGIGDRSGRIDRRMGRRGRSEYLSLVPEELLVYPLVDRSIPLHQPVHPSAALRRGCHG